MAYTVKFYKGDYSARQAAANTDNAVAYVEQHFNASSRQDSSYSLVVVGSNASSTSKNWGSWYAKAIAAAFGTEIYGTDGVSVGGIGGRGDGNLRHTRMPAILLEPLFASNPAQAAIIRSEAGQARLASVLVESIQRFFPDGGLIAFSVGHKYKTSSPNDRGVPLHGGGTEADYAEKVLEQAKALLEQVAAPVVGGRRVRVLQGETVLWSGDFDEDISVTWDPIRGVLEVG